MFKEKYIKYKTKYIALKIQLGGEDKLKKRKKEKKLREQLRMFNAGTALTAITMPNYKAPSFLYSLTHPNNLDSGKLLTEYVSKFNSINLQSNSKKLKYDVRNYHLKITIINEQNVISLFIYFNKSYPFIEVSIGENNQSFPVFIIDDKFNIIDINPQINKIDIQNKQNIKFLIFQGLMKVQFLLLEVGEDHEISYDKLSYLKEKLELCNLIFEMMLRRS